MEIRTAGIFALAWMALVNVAGGAPDDLDGDVRQEQLSEMEEGQPIDSGFVILAARYLPPPYVVGRREDEVYVNGHRVAAESLRVGHRGGPGPAGRRGSPGRRGPPGPRSRAWGNLQYDAASTVAAIERRLADDALLIEFDGDTVVFIEYHQGIEALDILLSDASHAAKTKSLMEIGVAWISSARWAGLVEAFQPTAELSQRVRASVAERDRRIEQVLANIRTQASSPPLSSKLTYGINVGGIALAVIALGSLLSHRPNSSARWRELDTSGEGVPLVVRNIILVVLLGLFDLACTLVAQRSGGFWELNPLGSQLVDSPAALAGFKIPLLVLSAVILLTLRRYRGAQIASWWLCLVCTVLTFRWATYNSMFLS